MSVSKIDMYLSLKSQAETDAESWSAKLLEVSNNDPFLRDLMSQSGYRKSLERMFFEFKCFHALEEKSQKP